MCENAGVWFAGAGEMLRLVVIALIVIVAWVLLIKLYRELKGASVDWTGWAFAAGFVSLAFYLRHVTGLG
jgi:hypothetical protein